MAGNLSAQWKLINPLPTNNNLTGMLFVDLKQGLAVGLNGTILKTVDGGDNWKVVPTSSRTNLNGIASPDSSTLFICGNNGLIIKTDIGFYQVDTIESGRYGNLNDIVFLDDQTGFCIGNGGVILKTTDGGQHWLPTYAPYTSNLSGLSFPEDSVGYMVGQFYVPFSAYSCALYKTRNQGGSWELVDTLKLDDTKTVCFTDSLTGFLTSYDIYKTADGGKSWTNTTELWHYVTGLVFQDPLNGLAAMYDGPLYRTSDGGNSWVRIAKTGPSSRILAINTDTLFTFGIGGDIRYSRDGGTQWTLTGEGKRQKLELIEFPDTNNGYILGDSVLYRSTDAGITWSMDTLTIGNIWHAAIANANRALAITSSGSWVTQDGFHSWHRVGPSLPKSVTSSAFADDRIAYITGVEYGHFFAYSVILRSEDGGETWKNSSIPDDPIIGKMYFLSNGTGFAMGFSGGLYKTSNKGDSWEKITKTAERFTYRQMHFPTRSTGYVCGVHTDLMSRVYKEICKSEDGGDSWTSIYLDEIPYDGEFTGVYFSDNSNGFVTVNNGRILKTTDGGNTWAEDFSSNALYGIGGTGDYAWAIGGYGTILTNRFNSMISNGLPNPELIEQMYPIIALSPNPFTDRIDITIGMEQNGPVTISVTDFSGRRLGYYTGHLPAGESIWTLNGNHLAAGLYLLSVTAGNQTGTARVLKVNN
ncbi:MAG: YCF48-related protein [Bacteroidales bacterium]